jgi:hypothetical protein
MQVLEWDNMQGHLDVDHPERDQLALELGDESEAPPVAVDGGAKRRGTIEQGCRRHW